MKKTIISLVIVAAAIAGLVFILNMKRAGTSVPVVKNPTETESKHLVTREPTMVSVAEDSYLVGITGTYPQFSQADAAFNAKIKQVVTDGVADFKKIANDNYQAQLSIGGDDFQKQFAATGGYTYKIDTRVVQSNDNYISVLIRFEGYSGGAHPYHGVIAFNYDVKKKKEITSYREIYNLFDQKDVVDMVRGNLRNRFMQQSGEPLNPSMEQMIIVGTDPKVSENYQNFSFIGSAEQNAVPLVCFYFSEYQVAPYVYGEQEVCLPDVIERGENI